MGAMREQFVISLSDLRFVCIECPHCHTKVTLDMERDFVWGKVPVFCPSQCPACREAFDSSLHPAVDEFHKAYRAIPANLRGIISFLGEETKSA